MSKKKKKDAEKPRMQDPDFIIYTDGGCTCNPGGPGGIGVVVIDTATGEIREISKGYTATTNNRMEISAIIAGITLVPEGRSVVLYPDSQYSINCIRGFWSRRKNTDLWEEYDTVSKGKTIDTVWVKGHNNDYYNEKCDALATLGIQASEKEIDTGYLAEKEAAREFFEEVDDHLQKKQAGGSMAVIIVIPPELSDEHVSYSSVRSLSEERHIHSSCARSIIDFYLSNDRSFKAYLHLKTGGIDAFSRQKAAALSKEHEVPQLYLSTLQKYLSCDKDVDCAARWNARGLSITDSIRKALVDAEVRENAIGRH